MSTHKWHEGPPPSPGWWPSDITGITRDDARVDAVVRWWNGRGWSFGCTPMMPRTLAAERAQLESTFGEAIRWTKRPGSWPKRSRT